MRWKTLRGPKKLSMQAMLTFGCHKIATMLEEYIENGNYLSNIENKKRRKNDKSRRD